MHEIAFVAENYQSSHQSTFIQRHPQTPSFNASSSTFIQRDPQAPSFNGILKHLHSTHPQAPSFNASSSTFIQRHPQAPSINGILKHLHSTASSNTFIQRHPLPKESSESKLDKLWSGHVKNETFRRNL